MTEPPRKRIQILYILDNRTQLTIYELHNSAKKVDDGDFKSILHLLANCCVI